MKRMISLMLALMLTVTLVACGGGSKSDGPSNDPATQEMIEMVEHMDERTREAMEQIPVPSAPDAGSSAVVPNTGSNTSVPNTPAVTPEPEPEPEPEPKPVAEVDPYAVLVTPVELCKENGGIYVMRNGKNYMTGGKIKYEQIAGTGIGQRDTTGQYASLYYRWSNLDVVSMGDVPILTLQDGDKLVRYGSTILDVVRVEEPTASIRVNLQERLDMWYLYTDPTAPMGVGDFQKSTVQQLQLEDSHGNIISLADGYNGNLNFGEKYKLEYFGGTQYYEREMVADSWYFAHVLNRPVINLDGDLSKEGYKEFDWSVLEPGLYHFSTRGVGTIGSYDLGYIRVG